MAVGVSYKTYVPRAGRRCSRCIIAWRPADNIPVGDLLRALVKNSLFNSLDDHGDRLQTSKKPRACTGWAARCSGHPQRRSRFPPCCLETRGHSCRVSRRRGRYNTLYGVRRPGSVGLQVPLGRRGCGAAGRSMRRRRRDVRAAMSPQAATLRAAPVDTADDVEAAGQVGQRSRSCVTAHWPP